jgi:hypothetical protein
MDSLQQSIKSWRHLDKYNRITGQAIFTPKMSDDEMAGIELWRGGRNLKMSFAFSIVGYVVVSTASWVPHSIIGKQYKGNLTEQDIILIISGVSGVFFIASLCELISGYNKISNAGILFEHKKFRVRTNGNNITIDL